MDEGLCVQVPRTDLCWGGLADIAEVTDIMNTWEPFLRFYET